MAENRETKNQRISKNQKEKLVEYMSTHLDLARGQFSAVNANIKSKGDWLSLTTTLNSLGGSNKTTDQWKKCWIDLKAGVKKKINLRRSFFNKTGGGSIKDAPQDLNDFEEQILSIMGTHAVDGDSRALEAGVPPFADPFISIEILEDEDMDKSYNDSEPCTSGFLTNELPSKKPSKKPKQSIKPDTQNSFKTGLEEAREMHTALVESINKMESKIDNLETKIDTIQRQNNDFFIKLDCIMNLLKNTDI